MDESWSRFWMAIALMCLSGAIFANSLTGSPLQVGALAQWASAAATFGAVWVALHNTRQTLAKGAERDELARVRREEVYTATLIAISDEVKQAIDMAESYFRDGDVDRISAKSMSPVYGLGALVGRIDRIPIHECHDIDLISFISAVRLAAHNSQMIIDSFANGDIDEDVDLSNEHQLIDEIRSDLQIAMPELFSKFSRIS